MIHCGNNLSHSLCSLICVLLNIVLNMYPRLLGPCEVKTCSDKTANNWRIQKEHNHNVITWQHGWRESYHCHWISTTNRYLIAIANVLEHHFSTSICRVVAQHSLVKNNCLLRRLQLIYCYRAVTDWHVWSYQSAVYSVSVERFFNLLKRDNSLVSILCSLSCESLLSNVIRLFTAFLFVTLKIDFCTYPTISKLNQELQTKAITNSDKSLA